MKPIISIVSGTYNRLALLQRMVASVRADIPVTYEIVLVDGGSTDGTQAWARTQDDVVLIEQGRLLGAVAAYNQGCHDALGEFVVILNDDVTVDRGTFPRALAYMRDCPEAAQVAFGHHYQRRGQPDKPLVQAARGYTYGQCCMTRRALGDMAGWWGQEGMRTYGGDSRLSLRLWEMGYRVLNGVECSVTDYEHDDALRKLNSDSPRVGNHTHPDLVAFNRVWPANRLPAPGKWIQAPVNRVLEKAAAGTLRTLRFKGMMRPTDPQRTALLRALEQYGPARQINQAALVGRHALDGFQSEVGRLVREFRPDLVILQAQRANNVTPETVIAMRAEFPDILWLNFDGDPHYPLEDFHYRIAASVHLQLVISPSLFAAYARHGIGVAYWPIGVEDEYLQAVRGVVQPAYEVAFMGGYYGTSSFPQAIFRGECVQALANANIKLGLYGHNWGQLGFKAQDSVERHALNASIYARSKLALSVSQGNDLWGYTSDRLYNICATGCPALVQHFPGIETHGFVDGQTCIVFDTAAELVDKTRYYIKHDAEREAIGAAGRQVVLERHTWPSRVETLFAMLEGL